MCSQGKPSDRQSRQVAKLVEKIESDWSVLFTKAQEFQAVKRKSWRGTDTGRLQGMGDSILSRDEKIREHKNQLRTGGMTSQGL